MSYAMSGNEVIEQFSIEWNAACDVLKNCSKDMRGIPIVKEKRKRTKRKKVKK